MIILAVTSLVTAVLRLLKHIAILLFVSLPLEFLGLLLVPVGIALSKGNKLPGYLKYFDCVDLYIDRDPSTYLSVINQGFLYRYYWLALRNPLNYFGYMVLGVNSGADPKLLTRSGSLDVGDNSAPGFLIQEYEIDNGRVIYEYYFVYKFNATHCFRFRLGYKIGKIEPFQQVQQVLVLQPYRSYSGT